MKRLYSLELFLLFLKLSILSLVTYFLPMKSFFIQILLNNIIKDLQEKGEFLKISKAGFYESMVHNVDHVIKNE